MTATQSFLSFLNMRIHTIAGDGNCFYRALALAYYNDESMHTTLRYATMNHMQTHLDDYKRYFDADVNLLPRIHAHKRSGVWNTDISDLVPYIASETLDIQLVVHNQDADGHIQTHTFGNADGQTINLLRVGDSHYNLLV
jgi:hypothetical protein